MTETKTDPKGSPKDQERTRPPKITEIHGTSRLPLPERHFRVVEEMDFPALKDRGLDPLVRDRGISERNARRAGIALPDQEG